MSHVTETRVEWGDTDAGGLIYYPRFFHFAVVGLNDYFSPAVDGGHPMERYRQEGYVLPAVETTASFHSPLRAGHDIAIETTVTHVGVASLDVAFAVIRLDDGDLVADVEVTFVLVDEEFEPASLPEEIRDCVRNRGDTANETDAE